MPPLPKPAATRQRRNKSATKATLEAPRITRANLPVSMTWHPMTTAWWTTIWQSPMAEEWVDGDIPALYRLARLDHAFWSTDDIGEATRIAAEIRQQQARFGLTPMDRRSLQWEIHRVEQAQSSPARTPRRVSDVRSTLRALA